ncbi:4'-phosphopantetheinyl transferase superfamily protein [Oscillochloris sp. ZM17-4]|uniref:4'-phosphopantetheinyl transferase family protein n=1 Tax=Oscillochloris sp. ZM17-4 TaxID=2866714 RepID=UPI001C734DC6|nr:4'-phosphopantetheinyl transferase superfamily protein [Oscillochloris sp. ZM17-4]MBX0330870.1 4'-phosphopantetheinyl transferase superfamily protein [Oscillochloris sp. ZM17-4]
MIDWLIAERNGLPPPGHILAPPELERYAGLRAEKRRGDWLLGRWAAKRLLRRHMAGRGLDLPLEAIMVLSDPDGAPRVAPWGMALALPHVAAELETLAISISHSEGRALCAMLTSTQSAIYNLQSAIAVGADIEQIRPRGAAFAEAYDTDCELALLAAAPPALYDTLATAIWSAKEAALKLTRHGLRVDTRAVTCLPAPPVAGGWASVAIHTELTGAPLAGRWREQDGCVITIVYEEGT